MNDIKKFQQLLQLLRVPRHFSDAGYLTVMLKSKPLLLVSFSILGRTNMFILEKRDKLKQDLLKIKSFSIMSKTLLIIVEEKAKASRIHTRV